MSANGSKGIGARKSRLPYGRWAAQSVAQGKLSGLRQVTQRIWSQRRQRQAGEPPKLYSVHAPEVECIAKGKVHKQYA